MSKIFVIVEHLNGKLNPSSGCSVSAAAAVKPEVVDVLVLADAPDAIAAEVAKIDGVAGSGRKRISSSFASLPTRWVPPRAPRARPSMRATCPTKCR